MMQELLHYNSASILYPLHIFLSTQVVPAVCGHVADVTQLRQQFLSVSRQRKSRLSNSERDQLG
jgi:hypothetical protein